MKMSRVTFILRLVVFFRSFICLSWRELLRVSNKMFMLSSVFEIPFIRVKRMMIIFNYHELRSQEGVDVSPTSKHL